MTQLNEESDVKITRLKVFVYISLPGIMAARTASIDRNE